RNERQGHEQRKVYALAHGYSSASPRAQGELTIENLQWSIVNFMSGRPPDRSIRARMSLLVTLLQALRRHMCVDLRRRQIAMAEQLLHAADVGAAVEQVRGEAVPQAVRARARVEAGQRQIFLQEPADATHGQPGAVLVQEDRVELSVRQGAAGVERHVERLGR